MTARILVVVAFVAVGGLTGCFQPAPLEPAGLACDADHPCPSGHDCCAKLCVPQDGGFAWPAPPAGIVWRQWAEGFGETRAGDGGTVTLGTCNRVAATIASPRGTPAIAVVTDRARLPDRPEGALRGKFSLPAPARVGANSGFVVVSDRFLQQYVVSVAVTPEETVAVYSGGNLLRRDESFGNGTTVVTPGEHTLEVRWRQRDQLVLSLDGVRELHLALDGGLNFDGGSSIPGELRLGINHYNNAAGQDAGTPGYSVELYDFQLADRFDGAFSDP